MNTTNLRKVGGSIMVAIPPAFLKQLDLEAGAVVALNLDDGQLVIKPAPKPRYTLAQLLAESDYTRPLPESEREWVDAPAVGEELL